MNFPSICSNIPAAPAYGVYISQLIRYSRTCGSYQDFLDRGLLLTRKLPNKGFLLVKLKLLLRKVYGRHHDLVDRYEISVSHHSWLITGFVTRLTRRVSLMDQELLTLPVHPPVFRGVLVTRSLVSYVCFVYRCLSFCNFFTIVLSVLRYTDSDWYLQTLLDNECHFVSGQNSVYFFHLCSFFDNICHLDSKEYNLLNSTTICLHFSNSQLPFYQ